MKVLKYCHDLIKNNFFFANSLIVILKRYINLEVLEFENILYCKNIFQLANYMEMVDR